MLQCLFHALCLLCDVTPSRRLGHFDVLDDCPFI